MTGLYYSYDSFLLPAAPNNNIAELDFPNRIWYFIQ
jgi:hypothetical protein